MTAIPKTKPVRLKGRAMEALRRLVFERDGYLCRHMIIIADYAFTCLKPVTWQSGHLCHRQSRGAGGSDTLENCFVGCAECHMRQHTEGFNGKPVPSKDGSR